MLVLVRVMILQEFLYIHVHTFLQARFNNVYTLSYDHCLFSRFRLQVLSPLSWSEKYDYWFTQRLSKEELNCNHDALWGNSHCNENEDTIFWVSYNKHTLEKACEYFIFFKILLNKLVFTVLEDIYPCTFQRIPDYIWTLLLWGKNNLWL